MGQTVNLASSDQLGALPRSGILFKVSVMEWRITKYVPVAL
nr:MAG TPA: hypothetical protein [Caudoviricetes sp.]DAZ46021.1 MAG TPA: hypothetical protein [Caudoviricetes sp.]